MGHVQWSYPAPRCHGLGLFWALKVFADNAPALTGEVLKPRGTGDVDRANGFSLSYAGPRRDAGSLGNSGTDGSTGEGGAFRAWFGEVASAF